MIIAAIVRNSLNDYPGRPAVVIFTQGCNWRCPYCHNAQLISMRCPNPVEEDDVFCLLRKRPERARNLVVTGGEPTLQRDLIEFLQSAKKEGICVKLDTNGSRPDVLKDVLGQGLVDFVAMDVKGPLALYERFCGRGAYKERVAQSIELLRNAKVNVEFRTTIVPALHGNDDLRKLALDLADVDELVLQGFQSENVAQPDLRNSENASQDCLQAATLMMKPVVKTRIRGES